MAVINQGGGIIQTEEQSSAGFTGLFAAILESFKLLEAAGAQDGPSAAGAQVAGAFVDLSRVPKFQVTDTGLADTDFTITHNLGFTPSIFILLDAGTVPGILYRGSTSPNHADNDSITLRYTGANASIWVGVL